VLPARFVGTVVTADGEKPFVLDTASGQVSTGRFEDADPMQATVARDALDAAARQVRLAIAGAREVRMGEYHCAKCGEWIDVVRTPAKWGSDRCADC
jgi:RNA polymerase-binding transcription factor DksA